MPFLSFLSFKCKTSTSCLLSPLHVILKTLINIKSNPPNKKNTPHKHILWNLYCKAYFPFQHFPRQIVFSFSYVCWLTYVFIPYFPGARFFIFCLQFILLPQCKVFVCRGVCVLCVGLYPYV